MHSCLGRRTEIKDILLRLIDSLLQKDETRGRPWAAPLGGPPTSTEQVKFTAQPARNTRQEPLQFYLNKM